MQKRKFDKKPKASGFDDSELPDMLFERIMEEQGTEHLEIGEMVRCVITTAVELSKLVIENKIRNSDHMIDEDIYRIYGNSFKSIIQASSLADE